jgi:N-succinyldiaminopimelate aminotransferase
MYPSTASTGYPPERLRTYAAGVTAQPLTRTPPTAKLAGFGTTIFAEMSALAVQTGSINLGQGFPDTDGPQEVLDAAVDAIRSGVNQYPPGPGVPVLRQAIADHQRRFYGLELDPDRQVLVTAGATEALAGALLGMLDTGDEVVVFEPMYDSYQACIALAGAIAKPVVLRPGVGPQGQYGFDADELRAAFSARTKLILLNTPHNPTGKVFTIDELTAIGVLAEEFGAIVVTDEVYEHLVFSGARHVPMATLPGMAGRTLTISSGGKTFNTTGWKVGWASGPADLVEATKTAKQFPTTSMAVSPPISRPSAIACSRGSPRPVSRLTSRRRRTSPRSTSDPSLPTATATPSAARCPPGSVWWRSRTRCSMPTRSTAGTSFGLPAASGSR